MTQSAPVRAIALAALLATSAYAQEPSSPPAATVGTRAITTNVDAVVLDALPNDGTVFSLLETVEPPLISDRISGGGIYTGQAPRIGGFLSSWSQTLFRIGDVSLSDPTGSGAPLLLPDIDLWSSLRITTGMMPADLNAPGVAVSLEPRTAGAAWQTTIAASGGPFSSADVDLAPAKASYATRGLSLRAWDRAAATASGPLITDAAGAARVSGFFAGSWMRNENAIDNGNSGSAFAHVVFTPDATNTVHAIAWAQKNRYPVAALNDGLGAPQSSQIETNGGHLQAAWEHRGAGAAGFRVFGAYTQRTRSGASVAPGGIFERLVDGPVSQAAFEAPDTVRQWTFGARVPSARIDRHVLDAGIETGGARDRSSDYVQGTIGELVDRIPARLWTFNAPIAPVSDRRLTTAAAYVTDHISVTPALTVDAGVRLDMTRGSAQGAPAGISWTTVLPRARAAWRVTDAWAPVVFAGVSRSANSLPLDLLAFGDPGAPTASVSQWLPSSPQTLSSAGALVAVVGPGAGTDPAFMRIDPGLKRPTTDELVIGIDAHPSGALTLHGTGFLRRERHLLTLSDPGAPASAFTMIGVPDPGLQLENPVDDQLLPVFDRMPASFGADRYLLTNASGKAATSKSLEISAELHTDHVTLFGGASANQSEAAAAALGFGPLENDQDIVIDAFVDPNAATFARGRLFTDRAYTIKLASVVRLPGDTRVGIAARYQDGQPFSRLVIAPDLNQGAQAIRAFPNGQSRFTFTETVDMRVQKGLAIGQDRLDLVLDVFNLINTGNEIEERVVSGDAFRSVTAVQPVRVFRAGFRIEF